MSQQLQITGGAKVRSLEGVITGSTGVLGSLPINGSNGIPQLDVNGKILVSQLPNSVMEYLGTWNAATNTPTLVNGTGNAGDVYLCNVAGTVNFGAGPITFGVGDQVIYSGTIWQKAGGSTGTVTSVSVTETGDALTITGSPITTSGTINIGFAGTSGQYVNGAGGLTTFPTLLSSVGLSMPSAFNVSNSPLTSNGTIAVTGAGLASQYVRGDGTLANFPTSGGGGGSVSYYLNGSINQGTFGGNTYYEMNKVPVIGAGTNFTINANGYISQFITDANDPSLLEIPGGNWNFEMYFSASSGGGTPSFYVELYKYNGSTFTLIASSSASPEGITNGTAIDLYTTALAVPTTSLTITDRLAVRVYVTHSGRTITLHTEDNNLCQVITTFSTGITALNGLTAQVQYFGTGTSGSDFNISSATASHTFNLPIASATNTGKLSSTDWTTFNNKQNVLTNPITGTGTVNYLPKFIGITALGNSIIYDNGTNVGIGTVSPSFKLDVSGTGRFTGQLTLGSTITNGTYTYTLPGATGVLALTSDLTSFVTLGTLQTITGTKIYSSLQYFDNNVYIKHGISGSSSGYTTLGANASGLNINLASGTSNNSLNFASTSASNTYTFPNATGTIALTSNLSSYVPTSRTLTINGTTYDLSADRSWTISGGVSGSGTTNYVTKWTSSSAIGNSIIYDSGSNVGIGTASPNSYTGYTSLTLNNATFGGLIDFNNNGVRVATIYNDASSFILGSTTGFLTLLGGGSERMRITSTGNVGIGSTNPLSLLEVKGGTPFIRITDTTTNSETGLVMDANGAIRGGLTINYGTGEFKHYCGVAGNSYFQTFHTNGSERMRITSTGTGLFGTTTASAGGFIATSFQVGAECVSKGSFAGFFWENRSGGVTSNSNWYGFYTTSGTIYLYNGSANIASINTSSGAYTALSDINKKKDFESSSIGLNAILGLKPTLYRMKTDNEETEKQLGFIAQEVKEFIPQAYVETKAEDKDGGVHIGLNYQAITAALVKAIQELKAEIDELKNK
jgi:hypothetical protein